MSNVVSLANFKKERAEKIASEIEKNPEVAEYLAKVEEQNRQNEERLKKERGQANKSVLRQYRIKYD